MSPDLTQWPDRVRLPEGATAEGQLAELLGALRDLEIELVESLPRLVAAAHDPELSALLGVLHDDTRRYRSRLRWIIGSIDLEVPGDPGFAAEAMRALTSAAAALIEADVAGPDRDAALVEVAMRIDRFRASVYDAARTLAGVLLYSEVESLLAATLADGRRAERDLRDRSNRVPLRLGLGARMAG